MGLTTEHRHAFATVRNNTSETLWGVSVVHKYSDVYKQDHQWGEIKAGEAGSPTMPVDYNTGAFTTGRDWWVVTWFSADFKTLYYSDPNNFRGIFDFTEKLAPDLIKKAADLVKSLAAAGGPEAELAAQAAAAAAQAVTSRMLNSEATEGFKQHILREEDQDKVTEIVINHDRTITFKSHSGNSDTVSSSKPVETK